MPVAIVSLASVKTDRWMWWSKQSIVMTGSLMAAKAEILIQHWMIVTKKLVPLIAALDRTCYLVRCRPSFSGTGRSRHFFQLRIIRSAQNTDEAVDQRLSGKIKHDVWELGYLKQHVREGENLQDGIIYREPTIHVLFIIPKKRKPVSGWIRCLSWWRWIFIVSVSQQQMNNVKFWKEIIIGIRLCRQNRHHSLWKRISWLYYHFSVIKMVYTCRHRVAVDRDIDFKDGVLPPVTDLTSATDRQFEHSIMMRCWVEFTAKHSISATDFEEIQRPLRLQVRMLCS